MSKNYYEIFSLPDDATEDEIKVVYHKLAIKYHPDKNPGDKIAEEKFRAITNIYETLRNPEKRKKYDSQFIKQRISKRGANLSISLNVTIFELIERKVKCIAIERRGLCKECAGTGATNRILKKCIYCDGTGLQGFSLVLGAKKKCTYCKGVGKIPDGEECAECNGTALMPERVQYTLTLNPFLEIVRIPKLGNCYMGGTPGDLIINLIIAKNHLYKVSGLNVTRIIEISPAQAIIGDLIKLKVFKKNIQLKIPSGTQDGQRIRLIDKGITYKCDTGNFDAIIHIKIPLIISEKEKRIYQELLNLEKEVPCLTIMSF